MKIIFDDQYEEFIKSLNEACTKAIFYNTLKQSKKEIQRLIDFKRWSNPYSDMSDNYDCDKIGKTISYDLGLIYPQEISASIPAQILNPRKARLIVDMCSAPGGKSINMANISNDDSLIIMNEYDYKRSKILLSNIERMGIANYIITNMDGDSLAKSIKGQADYVLLDAPCSGEGMIRKDHTILDNYNYQNILACQKKQFSLIDNAYDILMEGGYLVYSTCTYAIEENEDVVRYALNKYPDLELIDIDHKYPNRGIKLPYTVRFSTLDNTEGQFCALFKKRASSFIKNMTYLKSINNKVVDKFINDNLDIKQYYLYEINDKFYMSLKPLIDLGRNVIRYGIEVGEIKKNIFYPSHQFYRINKFKYKYKIDLSKEEYFRYRQGLSLFKDINDGFYALTYQDYPFSFTKAVKKELKNKYPKGLRY